jgi:hypothetical protein
MFDSRDDPAGRRRRAAELLIGHLQAAGSPPWPGADGLTVADILRAYPRVGSTGKVPGLPELLARHPDLAEELQHLVTGGRSGPECQLDRES